MFPPSLQDLSQLLAAIVVILLATSYFVSSTEGPVEVLISHRNLENLGLALGGIYLLYVVFQLGVAVAVR